MLQSQAQRNNSLSPLTKLPVNQVYIALGSNLENPMHQVRRAFDAIASLPTTRLLACSSLYRSAPEGGLAQPDYINAAVHIETDLTPLELLKSLFKIERCHGRTRGSLNTSRTLDLDMLMYGDIQYHDNNLTLPHPRISKRAFVLQPLIEIAPDCYIPGQGAITKLLTACCKRGLERIDQ